LLDFTKLTREVAEKTTIEDSVVVLLGGIMKDILLHPADENANVELATGIVENLHILSVAVAENT
jgi:hypothetical protein